MLSLGVELRGSSRCTELALFNISTLQLAPKCYRAVLSRACTLYRETLLNAAYGPDGAAATLKSTPMSCKSTPRRCCSAPTRGESSPSPVHRCCYCEVRLHRRAALQAIGRLLSRERWVSKRFARLKTRGLGERNQSRANANRPPSLFLLGRARPSHTCAEVSSCIACPLAPKMRSTSAPSGNHHTIPRRARRAEKPVHSLTTFQGYRNRRHEWLSLAARAPAAR